MDINATSLVVLGFDLSHGMSDVVGDGSHGALPVDDSVAMSNVLDVSNDVSYVGDHVAEVVDMNSVLPEDVSDVVVDMSDLDVLGILQVLDHVVDNLSLLRGRELLDSELVSDHAHDLQLHGSPEGSSVLSDVMVATSSSAFLHVNGIHLVKEVFELLLVKTVGSSSLELGEGLFDETSSLSKGA